MTSPSGTCQTANCRFKVPAVLKREGLCLDHYLEAAFRRLAAATEDFQSGRDVDYDTMDWLLAQVDFILEAFAQEDVPCDADQRTKLLQLLLGVANLHEYVRRYALTTPHSY